MECNDYRDSMMGVLYGEATADERASFDVHLRRCASCREELAAFRRLRRELVAWEVPQSAPPPRGRNLLLGLAAAATLLVALGGAWRVSGSEVRYEHGEWSLRLGRQDEALAKLRAEEKGMEDRLLARQDEALRSALAQSSSPATLADGETLQRVREMIQESNSQQSAAFQAILKDHEARSEAQRRIDLARVSAGLSYLDGRTGRDVARTTELVNYVLQASQKR